MVMYQRYPWAALSKPGASFYLPAASAEAVRAAWARHMKRNPGLQARIRVTTYPKGILVERVV